ncbi:Suppressor of tumorigenicity 7 protein [Trichinella pseudospiralis]|uniref:Protein ST7 homolog n=2 Tax=Trichinella pseudospiralis TaxID=6337 RepID=A0A0V1FA51_TRIPS|nr:Suppressor of tumorigenicity 7 -like protein [Trichinella pseudospiralis]
MFDQLKSWITWSWTYLWVLWFALVMAVFHLLHVPVKLHELIQQATVIVNDVSPKYYIIVAATSSLVSGIILKYCSAYVDSLATNSLSSWFPNQTRTDSSNENTGSEAEESNGSSLSDSSIPECKVWRNSMCLFRGAEYERYTNMTGREALSYYDMNLSAQDHQNYFLCSTDAGKFEYETMQTAWRERDPKLRLELAHKALAHNQNCATALILLAEEECKTVFEAEQKFKLALKAAEDNFRKSHSLSYGLGISSERESLHKRDTNVVVYIRRRLALCARRFGRLKEAVKIMKDLIKEFPTMYVANVYENLIETLLEMQSYGEVQSILTRYDEFNLPKSATIYYTTALLKVRLVAERFSPSVALKKGLTPAEMSAVEAIHKALEFNPHVPKYLLEMKPLILPPEHILKRGDSEAIAYSFWHISHWQRVQGALDMLRGTFEGTFRAVPFHVEKAHLFYPYPACTEATDRELLPSWHELSVYPRKETPSSLLFASGLAFGIVILMILVHQFPKPATELFNLPAQWFIHPLKQTYEAVDKFFLHVFSQIEQTWLFKMFI